MGPAIPVIQLTLSSMREQFVMAFTDNSLRIDTNVIEAVNRFCTPENLQTILNAEVSKAIEGAIRNEVEKYYAYGEGRHFVASAVKKMLDERHARVKELNETTRKNGAKRKS